MKINLDDLLSLLKKEYQEAPKTGILKINEEQRVVYGWAYVSTYKGEVFEDSHNDTISTEELVKAANDFMLDVRQAKAMHKGDSIGEVIHSLPISNDIAKALDIQTDREGWIIAMKIHDDEVWEGVKSGKYRGFSIGGTALREQLS